MFVNLRSEINTFCFHSRQGKDNFLWEIYSVKTGSLSVINLYDKSNYKYRNRNMQEEEREKREERRES